MAEGIRLKAKRKPVKKFSKEASEEEAKPKKKKTKKIEDDDKLDLLSSGIDLDEMSSEDLDDEAKKSLIRSRTAQAEKQQRLNQIAEGKLVERKEVIEVIKTITFGAVEILDLFPDQVGPLVHKKTPKQIRDKLVKSVDKVKMKFINLLMEFDDE